MSQKDTSAVETPAGRSTQGDALQGSPAERDAKITALEQMLAERNADLGMLRDTLARQGARIDSLQKMLSALHASVSWRMTAPLRALRAHSRRTPLMLGRLLAHVIRSGAPPGRAGSSVADAAGPRAPLRSAAAPAPKIIFNIDAPEIVNGVAILPVMGALTVAGWALSPDATAAVHCEVDGRELAMPSQRTRREDVARAFPDFGGDGALFSGFEFSLPGHAFAAGRHQVTIRINGKAGIEEIASFTIDVAGTDEEPEHWRLRERIPGSERMFAQGLIERFAFRSKFTVWIDCREANVEALPATLRSVASQSYESWEAVVTGAPETRALAERAVREELAHLAARIHCFPGDGEAGELIAQARPRDLVLPLEAGDLVSADALFELACAAEGEKDADFIYADERRPNIASGRVEPFLKPDWSPALLLAANYVGKPWCATVALLRSTGRPLLRRDPAGNFDLVLACTERAARVLHVQKVLAQRGAHNIETGGAQTRALESALRRRGLDWVVGPGRVENTFRCRPKTMENELVSIIIPTCAARGLIKTCIQSLRAVSSCKRIEIIVVDNIADAASVWKPWLRANADVVVEILERFNWSRFNNLAARKASGSYLLFLNDDIEVIEPGWLDALREPLAFRDVAVAGPQLLYPDRRVQHAGMFLAGPALGRHCFRMCAEDEPGYFGLALTQREVIAVTGACMLVRADIFRSMGGFEEAHAIVNNDLDFCLRINAAGLRCVYTPFARLVHHEKASRTGLQDAYDEEAFRHRWGRQSAQGDPYFHPHLDRRSDSFAIDLEPVQRVFAVRPVYDPHAIRRILAVKVDHIGDFVTAFPAFRRLKGAFPAAELVALVAPACVALAGLEPSIDRVIPFRFFDERSELGRAQLDEASLHDLAQTFAACKFDLAVDLRKYPETRRLVQLAGASVTAGFDDGNQFPWLDIALTFEGNKRLARKRQHVADDLLDLVEAIIAAGRAEPRGVVRPPGWADLQAPVLARLAELGLGKRRMVCVHPGAGNETKQWPLAYFADLIDLLLATEDVDIALIGGADETAIGRAIVERVGQRDRVCDLVGRVRLDQLPCLIDACALFVGNDSGPKHIAAGLGVPTVAIQSGVVDAREWGPLGARAVAVARSVICSPCYKTRRAECHRGLACLEGLTVPHVAGVCRQLLRCDRTSPRHS